MFEISKMYDIGIKKYRDYKFRVSCKNSIPLAQFYINLLRQEHQIELSWVAIKS